MNVKSRSVHDIVRIEEITFVIMESILVPLSKAHPSRRGFCILQPFEAPNANAFAERWVHSVREELLDHVLVLNQAHLRRILQIYIDYYNARRPHQSLKQQASIPYQETTYTGAVTRRSLLGGILNDYYRIAGGTSLFPKLS